MQAYLANFKVCYVPTCDTISHSSLLRLLECTSLALTSFFHSSLFNQPVPVTPKGSQLVAESFFRTPGGPMKLMGSSCVDFDGANKTSVGTLFVPQRKLEVSTEDVH